ncbi:MAG TPA: plastocyanin/azurin family copper-binding protein [Pseudomonadota bacterium]|nr:plastocyanin/azurin family copper-binding protein [Pseudomonadota bacterium]
MNTRVLGMLALVSLGMVAACDQSNTGSNNDLATASQDLSTGGPDMTSTADMAGPTVYNGCNTADFVDRTATTAIRTVSFGVGGFTYSPKCITIAAGQQVMFSGTFASHPLRPGVGSMATAGSPNNPIMATSTGTTASFTFPTAGMYPYNCQLHDGSGMNGVVKVQ